MNAQFDALIELENELRALEYNIRGDFAQKNISETVAFKLVTEVNTDTRQFSIYLKCRITGNTLVMDAAEFKSMAVLDKSVKYVSDQFKLIAAQI